MNFDSILDVIGNSGRIQYLHVLLALYAQCLVSISIYGPMFMEGSKQFRCKIDGCDDNSTVYETSWMSKAIPKKLDQKSQKLSFDGCQMFVRNSTSNRNSCSSDDYFTSEKIDCTPTIFKDDFRTLTSDWNLTCDRKFLLTVSITIFMIGHLCGVYTFGVISDIFGRRLSIMVAIVLKIISATAIIFSLNIYMFTVFRFLIAASSIAILTSTFVLLSELLGTKNRYLLVLATSGWNMGEYVLVAIAYFVQNWQHLQIIISSFSILFIFYYWLVTESPKWLISKRKFDEAEEVIKKLAKIQKKEIPSKLLLLSEEQKSNTEKIVRYSPLDLFRSTTLRFRMILISLIWFIDSVISYTISFGAKNMLGSIYLNFVTIVSGGTIGILLSLCIIKYLSRKTSMIISLTVLAIICFLNIIISPEKEMAIGILGMLGRLIVNILFNITYIYTAELFPTLLRSSAVGTGSTISRMGGIIAPFIVETYSIWRPIPYIVIGSFGLIGALVIFWLPETFNKPLPNTVEELKDFKVKPRETYTQNSNFDCTVPDKK